MAWKVEPCPAVEPNSTRRNFSHSRQKHAGVFGMDFKSRAEFPRQESFFLAGLDVETEPHDDKGHETPEFAHDEGRAQQAQQHASVDGMAHGAVWTHANQFVVFADADCCAPVLSEDQTRPHRKSNARRRQQNSSDRNRDRVRRKTHAEPGIVSAGIKEQSEAESEGKHITEPLPK